MLDMPTFAPADILVTEESFFSELCSPPSLFFLWWTTSADKACYNIYIEKDTESK